MYVCVRIHAKPIVQQPFHLHCFDLFYAFYGWAPLFVSSANTIGRAAAANNHRFFLFPIRDQKRI